MARPGSAPSTSSSPTTTSAAGSPPGCGGCSTTSGIGASPCSTAASEPGRPRATRCRPTRGPSPAPGRAAPAPEWTGIIDRDELRRSPRRRWSCSTRAAGPRYRGEIGAGRPGAPVTSRPHSAPRPTATSARTADCCRRRSWRHASARWARAAIGRSSTSCGSARRLAPHLAMRLAGLPDPILYPGSWSDWSRAGYPVATGPEPGLPPD